MAVLRIYCCSDRATWLSHTKDTILKTLQGFSAEILMFEGAT